MIEIYTMKALKHDDKKEGYLEYFESSYSGERDIRIVIDGKLCLAGRIDIIFGINYVFSAYSLPGGGSHIYYSAGKCFHPINIDSVIEIFIDDKKILTLRVLSAEEEPIKFFHMSRSIGR